MEGGAALEEFDECPPEVVYYLALAILWTLAEVDDLLEGLLQAMGIDVEGVIELIYHFRHDVLAL